VTRSTHSFLLLLLIAPPPIESSSQRHHPPTRPVFILSRRPNEADDQRWMSRRGRELRKGVDRGDWMGKR
jgi:competence protein ComGC